MATRIEMRMGERTAPLSLGPGGGPLLSSHGTRWGGLPVELHRWGGPEAPAPVGPCDGELGMLLVLEGSIAVTVREGRGERREVHRPGSLVLLSGDARRQVLRKEGEASALALHVTPRWKMRIDDELDGGWRGRTLSLAADPTALLLGRAVHGELSAGASSGALFGESLSMGLLSFACAQLGRVEPATPPGLSSQECSLLRDYIREHLARDLTVAELAALVGLRPRQFTARFRVSFGAAPYHHVLHERVHQGARLLRGGKGIAEAALEVGFCSQSHFTAAFRRVLGVTPGRYLRQLA